MKDWSQAQDLARQHPEKRQELQRLWLIEASKVNVLPLDDRLPLASLLGCGVPPLPHGQPGRGM